MKLLQLASAKWKVWLVYDDRDNCVVLGGLSETSPSLKAKMLRLLRQQVPFHGAPKNIEKSRHLRGNIYEFKADQNKGPGIRVLYFQDSDKYICTHAFEKDQKKTPPREIERAETIEATYLRDKKANKLKIELLSN